MEFQYQPEILAQLPTHGVRPLPHTRPALVFRYLGDLYRYELRRLRRLREGGTIPQREYGGRVVGPRIVTEQTRQEMRKVLAEVRDGTFAKKAMTEFRAGSPTLNKMREQEAKHPIEVVGKQVRSLFSR